MLSQARMWHQSVSREFGYWVGKHSRLYSCPLWADKAAYTHAYLEARGIIRSSEIS